MNLAKLAIAAVLILGLGLGAGCSLFQPQPAGGQAAAGQGQQAGAAASQGAMGRYYDFDDIQVPNQLKLDTKRSLIFRAGKFKAGVLVFGDNLEVESLINFFVDTMQKDNWVLQGTYKYPRIALFFAKKGKTAIIQIVEQTLSTEVSIWVAPTL
ncbi:MAG: hypothetical protein AB1814_14300 [Thermodesulfobacteriota bacterium]